LLLDIKLPNRTVVELIRRLRIRTAFRDIDSDDLDDDAWCSMYSGGAKGYLLKMSISTTAHRIREIAT